jgi:hypothetical protein
MASKLVWCALLRYHLQLECGAFGRRRWEFRRVELDGRSAMQTYPFAIPSAVLVLILLQLASPSRGTCPWRTTTLTFEGFPRSWRGRETHY